MESQAVAEAQQWALCDTFGRLLPDEKSKLRRGRRPRAAPGLEAAVPLVDLRLGVCRRVRHATLRSAILLVDWWFDQRVEHRTSQRRQFKTRSVDRHASHDPPP
jgi:hypothetical protein